MVRKKFKISQGLDIRFILIISLLVVITMVFLYISPNFGFSLTSTSDYIAMVPYIFLFIISLYIIVTITGMFLLPAFGLLGFAVGGLLNEMYILNMITVEMMSGLSIQSIEFWCVVISLLFGGILVTVTSKRRK